MNRVRELRKRAGMQQKELAILVGVSKPTVSEWELNKKNPSGERLVKLTKIFGVDAGTILGYDPLFVPVKPGTVPIVGSIVCSPQTEPEVEPDGYAELPDGVHADFALRCKGSSMQPTFRDGDLVLIRKQPDVENGQIAAIGIDGETTLKHVYHREDGILLIADNASYQPIFIPAKPETEIIIHGLAVGYVRLF